jgi:hypothetical protein
MTTQKLSKEHFLEGDISDKSPEFKAGVKFGANNTLEEAILLLQSKFGGYSPTTVTVTKILKNMKIEDRGE